MLFLVVLFFFFFFFFFFSSRRRHTRSLCDWSSDVCSSDLDGPVLLREARHVQYRDSLGLEVRRHADDLADRKSTRLNSSHTVISYAVFCLKKKSNTRRCRLPDPAGRAAGVSGMPGLPARVH